MMERLTFDGNFCDIDMCDAEPDLCLDGWCTRRKVWERLRGYEDAEEQGRLVVLGSGNYPTLSDLWSIYESLIAVHDGDGEEAYTNGYRWGHRNGQIELLQYILQISDGSCEAPKLEAAEAKTEDDNI